MSRQKKDERFAQRRGLARPTVIALLSLILVGGALTYFVANKAKQPQGERTGDEGSTFGDFTLGRKELQVALITNGPLSDWGYNYAHNQALEYVEKTIGGRVVTAALGNVPETADAERIMRKLIDRGVNLIIASSFGYQDTTVKLAKEYPNVQFLQAWGFKPAANLGTYSAKMYEAWYVMGVVAGRMSKSNKLGVVAAHPIPPMKWQINAYVLGARSVNPNVEVAVTFINHWFDPTLASEATEALAAQGCDIVCGVLDNSVAVAQTAEKRGLYLIGHNADLRDFAPKSCLVGTRWLWGPLYVRVVTDMMNNKWLGSNGDVNGGFKEGYVGITDFSPGVPQSIRDEALAVKGKIETGEIAVYRGPIKDSGGKTVVESGQTLTHEQIMGMDWFVEGVR